jgi:hypothetical protein
MSSNMALLQQFSSEEIAELSVPLLTLFFHQKQANQAITPKLVICLPAEKLSRQSMRDGIKADKLKHVNFNVFNYCSI